MRNTFLMIDTATPICSVALSHGNEIIFSVYEEAPEGGHAARAGVLVEQALISMREHGLTLDAVAVSAGPGSYTGLRIGSSLAKGLCFGYSVPLIAVSTLEMMASGYLILHPNISHQDRIVPLIDARRDEVYTATFTSDLKRLKDDHPQIISSDIYFDEEMIKQEGNYHFFGNGVHKDTGISAGSFIMSEDFLPLAEYMLPLVQRLYAGKHFVDTAYWAPNYLKEYVVKIARNKVIG